ncbi:MAG: HAD family phosphatase [Lachnospiraceae bacterium]|nr:HAD family phosphatase [Lachnospiraceae bacterium]
MLKAVIFDMDGVIFDSERSIIDCWIPVAEKYGIPDVLPQCLKCIGITETQSAKVFREVYGQDLPYEKIRKEVNEMYREFCDAGRLPMKKGVRELLGFLKENGIRIALASSGGRAHVEHLLGNAGILDYFEAVIGGDMVTRGKPAPDVFLKAVEELDRTCGKSAEAGEQGGEILPGDCLVIEDSYQGIRAAYAAGIPVIMVPDLLPPTEECGEKAEKILPSLTEVLQELKERLDIYPKGV